MTLALILYGKGFIITSIPFFCATGIDFEDPIAAVVVSPLLLFLSE